MDVLMMPTVICRVMHTMIRETLLPNREIQIEFSFHTAGKPAFDELDRLFQRDFLGRSDEQMEMVGHNDELVNLETSFASILPHNVYQQPRHAF